MNIYDQFVPIAHENGRLLKTSSGLPNLMLELVRRVHQPNYAIQAIAEYFRATSAVLWFRNRQSVDEFRVNGIFNRPDLMEDFESATFSASDQNIVVAECFARRAMRAGLTGSDPFGEEWLKKPYTRGIANLGIWGLVVCPVFDGRGEPLGVLTLYFKRRYEANFVFSKLPVVAQFINYTVNFMVSELEESVIERRKMGHEIQAAVKSANSSIYAIGPDVERLYSGDGFRLTQFQDIGKALSVISQSAGQFRFTDSIRDQRKFAFYLSLREEFNSVAYPLIRSRKDKSLTLSRLFLGDGDLEILISRVHLRQLLDNILGNAIKYSAVGGLVRTRIDRVEGGAALLKMSNTNEGLQKHEWGKIWRQGFRGKNASSSSERGEGLGLSIVRDICEIYDIAYSYKEEDQTSFHWSVIELVFPSEIVRWR